MKKPKRGRPALAAKDRREMFAVRLTAEERAAIKRAADAAGVPVSDWARAALLRATHDL